MNAANLSAIRSKVGLVFQHPDEQLFMPTVLEDVCFGPLNQGLSAGEARSRARAALDQVGASRLEDRPPYHLSFGEKRRVALAGVLAMRPEVLVLDEPTTYLDPPGQRQLAALLSELPQAKVIVTHDLNLARRLGARADFFRDGQIAASGGVEAIIRQFDWEW
jgi:cobalt/nickel transport system ATP-binding protein